MHIPISPEKQHMSGFGRTTSFDATLARIGEIQFLDRPGLGITVREGFLTDHTDHTVQ